MTAWKKLGAPPARAAHGAWEVFVHLSAESATFLARLDPRTQARPGHDVQTVLNMSAMHAFDVDTGATLLS